MIFAIFLFAAACLCFWAAMEMHKENEARAEMRDYMEEIRRKSDGLDPWERDSAPHRGDPEVVKKDLP